MNSPGYYTACNFYFQLDINTLIHNYIRWAYTFMFNENCRHILMAAPFNGPDPWDKFRSKPSDNTSNHGQQPPFPSSADKNIDNFDTNDFLTGAKLVYARILTDYAKQDFEELANFTTPDMLERLKQNTALNPHASQIDIILINACIIKLDTIAGEERAAVLFDAVLRYNQETSPASVQENWHFVRKQGGNEMWRLQQVEKQ